MHTHYNDKVVRQFAFMTIFWGIVGMLVGVVIAAQLWIPALNFDVPWLTYSRLRPLHTNAVIFAFGGSALIGTSLYVVQRTCSVRLISDKLAALVFWGWQTVIVLAVITLPLGITQSKEYAELEWPIDILITIVWVAYAILFFGTIGKRKIKHVYVANWFYGAFILTIAMLHIVNNLAIPVTLTKSYPIYTGAVDAMVQWWYGHNAVGFFLTAGFLGMMYYFIPKHAGRPIYSYRLSIVHFWALISIYMWAGPHHLHYTALPNWIQSLGMVFSIILLAPSWGGMINGIMTLSGAWDRLYKDPIVKMMVVALSFYGMSTFEGPLMAIKTVNALSHYTDWTVGHVHSGALGWVAMMTIASLYVLIPRLYGKTEMYSTSLINVHFWLSTIGILVYVVSMWIAGVMQGLMWRAFNTLPDDGTLKYTFIESIAATKPYYAFRLFGGILFLTGMFIMAYNVYKTVYKKKQLTPLSHKQQAHKEHTMQHETLEKNINLMAVFIVIVISIAGIIEIVPLMTQKEVREPAPGIKPYTPLQLAGRDVYVSEGCYNCHSQMIRPFRSEVERYGPYSVAGESVYDRPHQWGSKRTGPDLARLGGRYSDDWHRVHLINPRDLVPESNMPGYPWLAENSLDPELMKKKIKSLQTLGDPYSDDVFATIEKDFENKTEMDALIIYLQHLGVNRTGRQRND